METPVRSTTQQRVGWAGTFALRCKPAVRISCRLLTVFTEPAQCTRLAWVHSAPEVRVHPFIAVNTRECEKVPRP